MRKLQAKLLRALDALRGVKGHATITATVTHADGTTEDLGVIAEAPIYMEPGTK